MEEAGEIEGEEARVGERVTEALAAKYECHLPDIFSVPFRAALIPQHSALQSPRDRNRLIMLP